MKKHSTIMPHKKKKKLNYTILKRSHFLFLEKRLTLRFLAGAKLHYGPKITPEVLPYVIAETQGASIVNIYYLMGQLKKTLQLIYLNSYNFGTIVASALNNTKNIYNGINLENFNKNGIYYFFTKWCNGFLTNFSTLILIALLNKSFNKTTTNSRNISLDILETKRIPQLPTISVALNLQHWHCNEAHAIVIPQAIGIHEDFSVNQYSPTCILPFNGTSIPALVLLFLIKDTVLSAILDDKSYFFRDTDYMNFYFKKFTLFPKYEKKFGIQIKKNMKRILRQRPKLIYKKKIFIKNRQHALKKPFFFKRKTYINFFNTTNKIIILNLLTKLSLNLLRKNTFNKHLILLFLFAYLSMFTASPINPEEIDKRENSKKSGSKKVKPSIEKISEDHYAQTVAKVTDLLNSYNDTLKREENELKHANSLIFNMRELIKQYKLDKNSVGVFRSKHTPRLLKISLDVFLLTFKYHRTHIKYVKKIISMYERTSEYLHSCAYKKKNVSTNNYIKENDSVDKFTQIMREVLNLGFEEPYASDPEAEESYPDNLDIRNLNEEDKKWDKLLDAVVDNPNNSQPDPALKELENAKSQDKPLDEDFPKKLK